MNKLNLFLTVFLTGLAFGCTPAAQGNQFGPVTAVDPEAVSPTQSIEMSMQVTPTETPNLIPPLDFTSEKVFCADEPTGSPFLLSCSENGLSVFQSQDRRKTDSMLRREIPLSANGFSLSADVISNPAKMDKLDQNQFGFYFTTTSEKTFAMRMEGQYINFEEWVITDSVEVIDSFNMSYAPALNSAGRTNHVRFVCGIESCDVFGNDVLIGRSPFGTQGNIKALGFFTAANWDQEFGSILLEGFSAADISVSTQDPQSFMLEDNLTADNGTFTQMGLSGAFSDFEGDGFHFSPVIPYGYYAAKTGPSIANVSVSASVNMEFDPHVRATQYGGVVCRSSLDGMVMAVLRADATYTIYQDSPKHPFALLAKGEIEGLQAGRSDVAIRLDCIDDTISLFINNIQVESFKSSRYGIRFGRSGLFTKAGGAPYSDAIIFKNFSIKEIR